ncbi:MAG: hypothetical protein AB8B61_07575 [Cyclobacteriaceae bacterium]
MKEVIKKAGIYVVLILLVVTTASAQSKTAPKKATDPKKPLTLDEKIKRLEPRIHEWARRDALKMKEVLALTDEQVKQAEGIRFNYYRTIFKAQYQMRQTMSENSQQLGLGLKDMLNRQQQETFRQRRKEIFPKG